MSTKLISKLSHDLSADFEVVDIHPLSFEVFGKNTHADIEFSKHQQVLKIFIFSKDEDIDGDEIFFGQYSEDDDYNDILNTVKQYMSL